MKKSRLIIINILITVIIIICMPNVVYAEGKIGFNLSPNAENALPGQKLRPLAGGVSGSLKFKPDCYSSQ